MATTTRAGVAVVIRHVRALDGDYGNRTTTFYGPFLPHAGSAVTSMLWQLDQEGEADARTTYHESFVEQVFIGEGESDAAIVAAR